MRYPSVELASVTDSVDYGHTASATMNIAGPKFLRITDIQDGHVDWASVPFCVASAQEEKASKLDVGDIVFARTGATTGKSFFIRECPERAVFASYLIRVRPNRQIRSDFLARFFETQDYWAQIARNVRGAAQGGVNASTLRSLRVPLPPLDEQRRIAAILDQVDDLRRKRRRTLERLDDLRNAIFFDMFVKRESNIWTLVHVADIAANIRTGPFGSQLLHSEFVEEGIAVLGIDNAVNNEFRWDERRFITAEKYQSLRRYTVRPGDVLITLMGTCGRCAVVPDDIPTAINTKHLCCITVDKMKVLPAFLHASFLQHPNVLKQLGVQAKGAVMPGLNMAIIKSLELRVPPVDLQRTFASRIEALNKVRASCRAHQHHLDRLFASLQHLAFRGEPALRDAELDLATVG